LWIASVLLGMVVIGAPLACGAVHRPIFFVVLALAGGMALVAAALAVTNGANPKPHLSLALPILFLLIATAQIVPLPSGLRGLLDPTGCELVGLTHLKGAQPLSLDPPETYLELAKAAAALCVALTAMVMASGRRFRFVATGLVACAGLAALVVGFGHRAVAEEKIFGLFSAGRGLPIGPFINPNHTAEFLELAAFAALAFAFARPSRDAQRLWQIIAAVLAAGALSALSRGSLLALGAGALTWFLLAPKSDDGEPFHRTKFAGFLIGLLVIVGIALGFGAEKIIGQLMATGGDNLTKVSVWFDALKIVRAHPAGIGLGAFGRVYPVYQTLSSSSWFQFIENQPLGLLIEAGIPGAILILAALVLTLKHFAKNARRDRVEASMAAGLVAVLAHNLADFGLETLGVLLPFCVVLGAMFGRQAVLPESPAPKWSTTVWAAFATAAGLVGIVLLLSPSAQNFDKLLQSPISSATRNTAQAASRAHPTDYVYALAVAKLEPKTPASTSPRLRMLNRAILLCPLCTGAHAEAARDLWRLGRRQQSLLEWKTVIAKSPSELWWVFNELAQGGATPSELMALAGEKNRHELSQLLLSRELIDAAKQTLAASQDHESVEFHYVQTQIALQAKDLTAARKASQAAQAIAPRDPRIALMAAEVEIRTNDIDKAIELLRNALLVEPTHVELNRKLLGLLMQTDKWQAIDRALDGLRSALTASGNGLSEANINAARIFERRGQFRRAVSEYQAALSQNPDDPVLLLSLGNAAERSGSVSIAIDAYNAVLRRVPDNSEARVALSRIQHDKKLLEVLGTYPLHISGDH
jgi:tetratricopeptide (TPR) repeat protein